MVQEYLTHFRTNPFSTHFLAIHFIPLYLAGGDWMVQSGPAWACRAADSCRLGSPGGASFEADRACFARDLQLASWKEETKKHTERIKTRENQPNTWHLRPLNSVWARRYQRYANAVLHCMRLIRWTHHTDSFGLRQASQQLRFQISQIRATLLNQRLLGSCIIIVGWSRWMGHRTYAPETG